MKKKIATTLVSCTLILGFALRATAQTQEDECNHLVETVFDQAERNDVNQPEILQSIVTVAKQARECYGERRRDRIAWLLTNEVFALDLMRRHNEARALIELFFEEYFDDASDLFKGKFLQWRLLYNVYAGRYGAAADDYRDAHQYEEALPLAQRAVLHNDGAVHSPGELRGGRQARHGGDRPARLHLPPTRRGNYPRQASPESRRGPPSHL